MPLMAVLELELPIKWSLSDPAIGISHEQLSGMLGVSRWLRPNRIRHVALPAAFASKDASTEFGMTPQRRPTTDVAARRTKYVVERSVNALRKTVSRLADRIASRQSHWSRYEDTRGHYSAEDLREKRQFVKRALDAVAPEWVLDIGGNTGEFSELAAERSEVVAIDVDEVSVSRIYDRAREKGRFIQPLVVDAAHPTPATGWRNSERKSFLDRAMGRFDVTLMLAVGHHLRVSAGVPLAEIVNLGIGLCGKALVFEFVPVSDPMFRAIARGRESIYSDCSLENCKSLLEGRGRIAMQSQLSNGRTLFAVVPST
jgi:SAM-dependent methyltransferase